VHAAARTPRDRAIGDLARKSVDEGQLALPGQRRRRAGHDEASPLERAQARRQRLVAPRGLERRGPERPAHHRRVLEHVLLRVGQGIDPRGQQRADGARDRELGPAGVLEVTDDLLGVERVAFGDARDPLGERRAVGRKELLGELARGRRVERLERDLPHARPLTPTRPPLHELGASGGDDEERAIRARDDQLDHVQQRRLGPVQVLDHGDRRHAGRQRSEEARPGKADLLGHRLR